MSIGIWQVVLILLVILIIFGAGKLPKVMEELGKGLGSFKKGIDIEKDNDNSSINNSSNNNSSKDNVVGLKLHRTFARSKKVRKKISLKK